MDIVNYKKELRQEIRKQRALLTEEEIRQESSKALMQLLKTKEYHMAFTVFTYVSYQQELSTVSLIYTAFLDGKTVAVPKVISKQKQYMEFFRIKDFSELSSGFAGILEPNGTQEIQYPNSNSIMILPGILFDKTGKRLGYGGGFYDTYLQKWKKQGNFPITAGFAYDFQILEKNKHLPCEPHDQCVDMIITPTRVIYTKEEMKSHSFGYDKKQ